jgi:integrase/recombinase XerD
MPKKGQRGARRPLGAEGDSQGFAALADAYLEALRVRNYSGATIASREHHLREFIRWAEERGVTRPSEVTKPTLERYQRWLYHYRKKNGEPLSFRSQHGCLVPVRALFKWLCRQNLLLANPAADLDLPRAEKRLPRHVLTASEAERVLGLPDIAEPLGQRDRAMLETFYSTGMRRMELLGLKLYDLDQERGTIFVRQGKGKKDRMIPMGERAFVWVRKYLDDARPTLSLSPDDGTVFLTNAGLSFEANRLTQLVRDYVDAAEIGKTGSCHLFRHTCATLMLEGGADIRFIQQMLGHAKLETTQIYTQVSIRQLKEVHTRTHPARLTIDPELAAELADEEAELADGEAEGSLAP